MKRLLLGFSFLCFTLSGFAQQLPVKTSSSYNPGATTHSTSIITPNSGNGSSQGINSGSVNSVSQWYNWLSGYDSAIQSFGFGAPVNQTYPTYLYPDSS